MNRVKLVIISELHFLDRSNSVLPHWPDPMDILLLGCYIRFFIFSNKKLNSQLVKITIPPHPLLLDLRTDKYHVCNPKNFSPVIISTYILYPLPDSSSAPQLPGSQHLLLEVGGFVPKQSILPEIINVKVQMYNSENQVPIPSGEDPFHLLANCFPYFFRDRMFYISDAIS